MAAEQPSLPTAQLQHHLAPVGETEAVHLREMVGAEEAHDRSAAEVPSAPRGEAVVDVGGDHRADSLTGRPFLIYMDAATARRTPREVDESSYNDISC